MGIWGCQVVFKARAVCPDLHGVCQIRTPAASGQKSRLSLAAPPVVPEPAGECYQLYPATSLMSQLAAYNSTEGLRAPNNTPADSAGETLPASSAHPPEQMCLPPGTHACTRAQDPAAAHSACLRPSALLSAVGYELGAQQQQQSVAEQLLLAAQAAQSTAAQAPTPSRKDSGTASLRTAVDTAGNTATVDIPPSFSAASQGASMHAATEGQPRAQSEGLLQSQASVGSAAAAAEVADLQAQLAAATAHVAKQDARVGAPASHRPLLHLTRNNLMWWILASLGCGTRSLHGPGRECAEFSLVLEWLLLGLSAGGTCIWRMCATGWPACGCRCGKRSG